MESNDELKGIDNKKRMCYYFDDIIKIEDFLFDNILTGKKSNRDILVYEPSYKTLIDAKSLRMRFNKVDGFIRVYDGTRYLVLFGLKNMISFTMELDTLHMLFLIIKQKSKLIHMIPCLQKKIFTLHVIKSIKSVLYKDQNHYYYNIFFEKFSYKKYKYAIL